MWIHKSLRMQRKALSGHLEPPLTAIAEQCAACWRDSETLDALLWESLPRVPHCGMLYTVDKNGRQTSANVTRQRVENASRGQDLSRRPYATSLYPKRHFVLSPVYISQSTGRPCLTAVQPVYDQQYFKGFLMADFDLRDLPLPVNLPAEHDGRVWASALPVGNTRRRPINEMDRRMDDLLAIVEELICSRGIFHCAIHFSSGQAMLWHVEDSERYHLHHLEDILDPAVCLLYPTSPYPLRASLTANRVPEVLQRFATLRLGDDQLYLRGASLNIIEDRVGLNFSRNGSQYLSCNEFLAKDMSFWLGGMPAIFQQYALWYAGNLEGGDARQM